jgi:hypothetical protein
MVIGRLTAALIINTVIGISPMSLDYKDNWRQCIKKHHIKNKMIFSEFWTNSEILTDNPQMYYQATK